MSDSGDLYAYIKLADSVAMEPEAIISHWTIYLLYGEPSTHEDALYVWSNWKIDNDAHDELDVTPQYFIENS